MRRDLRVASCELASDVDERTGPNPMLWAVVALSIVELSRVQKNCDSESCVTLSNLAKESTPPTLTLESLPKLQDIENADSGKM